MKDKLASIHQRFERVAEAYGSNTAVRYLDDAISYRELNDNANAVAQKLQALGVSKGDTVAIALSHSTDLYIAMLAVLKCGAVYLPIDETLPTARIQAYFAAASVDVCISNKQVAFQRDLEVAYIYAEDFDQRLESDSAFHSVEVEGDDPAYIMFTSGSTGAPKAVVVPHRAVLRLVIDTNYIQLTESDSLLQFAPPSFDASTFEIWGALLNGAKLVAYSGNGLDPNRLKNDIFDNQVTVMWLTAALFHLVVNRFIEVLRPINVLLAGGDVLNPKYVHRLFETYPDITLINGYGPTENTTFTCCHVMNKDKVPSGNVPIGTEISGTDIHILDDSLNEVVIGEIGTLYASGQGVALGYLNDDRNEQAFFYNGDIAKDLIYNTGDLVRRNRSGALEFVGRVDNQVKVRGYRVSLDEIRLHLVELPEVSDAAVVVSQQDSGEQLLVAYTKLNHELSVTARELRAKLAAHLPAYMIPDQITFCSSLPIKPNGKIDKNKIQVTHQSLTREKRK